MGRGVTRPVPVRGVLDGVSPGRVLGPAELLWGGSEVQPPLPPKNKGQRKLIEMANSVCLL